MRSRGQLSRPPCQEVLFDSAGSGWAVALCSFSGSSLAVTSTGGAHAQGDHDHGYVAQRCNSSLQQFTACNVADTRDTCKAWLALMTQLRTTRPAPPTTVTGR